MWLRLSFLESLQLTETRVMLWSRRQQDDLDTTKNTLATAGSVLLSDAKMLPFTQCSVRCAIHGQPGGPGAEMLY